MLESHVDSSWEGIRPHFCIERIRLLYGSQVELPPCILVDCIFDEVEIYSLSYSAIKLTSFARIKIIGEDPLGRVLGETNQR